MERILIEREIARILAEMGVREERLSPTARLLQDLRIDGDDAREFFEGVSERFGTDLTVLREDWATHFGPEGLSVVPVGRILAAIGAWLHGRPGGAPASRPIHLSDVGDAVERGRWERSGG